MKIFALYSSLVAATLGFSQAEDILPPSSCSGIDLTFDDTPGVPLPESRGLLLEEDFYKPIGISRLACIRKGESPDKSACRLFDTANPVGNWPGVCNCEPNQCSSLNTCGDPDLASESLGNVLIVEERSPIEASDFPPDDNAFGGTILIEFVEPVTLLSISFLDIENSRPVVMEFLKTNGPTQIIGPVTGDNRQATAEIYLDGVTSATITLFGSGAITSFRYTRNCVSNSGGDPHFTRWGRDQRETFHGECDLALMQAPGLQVHVRTTIDFYYSYIAAAAVKVGDTTFQVEAEHPDNVLVDGVKHALDTEPQDKVQVQSSRSSNASLLLGTGNATHRYVFEQSHSTTKKRVYRLDLSDWSYVRFQMYGKFMTVSIHASEKDGFEGGAGLLGRFPDGELIHREGLPGTFDSFADFALEWQVNPALGDPILFYSARPPQMPYEICRLPTHAHPARRNLLRGSTSTDEAMNACLGQGVSRDNLDLCVEDVLATQDPDLAPDLVVTSLDNKRSPIEKRIYISGLWSFRFEDFLVQCMFSGAYR